MIRRSRIALPAVISRPLVIQIAPYDLYTTMIRKSRRSTRAVPWKPVIMKKVEPNWQRRGIAPGTYSLIHDQLGPFESLHPDDVAPSAAVTSSKTKVLTRSFR